MLAEYGPYVHDYVCVRVSDNVDIVKETFVQGQVCTWFGLSINAIMTKRRKACNEPATEQASVQPRKGKWNTYNFLLECKQQQQQQQQEMKLNKNEINFIIASTALMHTHAPSHAQFERVIFAYL